MSDALYSSLEWRSGRNPASDFVTTDLDPLMDLLFPKRDDDTADTKLVADKVSSRL